MGRAISRKLGMRNIDADRVIEQRKGKKLHELIEEFGMDGFKKIEKEVLLTIEGYGRFPAGYGGASAAIETHFLQLLPEDMHTW